MYVPTSETTTCPIKIPMFEAVGCASAKHANHEARLARYRRFAEQSPKILLLEPFYPPEAAWGSVKVEQGYLPPLGTISIYR